MKNSRLQKHVSICRDANDNRIKPASEQAMLAVLSDRCQTPITTKHGTIVVFWREWFTLEEAEYMRDYFASIITSS